MAICPNCQAPGALLQPCHHGDGFYCVDEADLAANHNDPLLGRAIGGRFVVTGTLGSGSMAQVYSAQQLEVDRPVALKVFRVTTQAGRGVHDSFAEERDRFAQEARVLGKLAHPNCVTLYDYGTDEATQTLYIAMEHVGGVSLRTGINRGLRMPVILSIAEQVLLALSEAHALGIVHRDLKPENIILAFRTTDVPTVKVVDFGIAKLLGHDRIADMTRIGALFGTPAYMSPEQCRGDKTIGPHSDIYALGCILFEMVAGELPYDATSPAVMIKLHTEAPIPSLKPRPGVEPPPGFGKLINRCLQKDPAHRFPDAPAMLAEVMRLRGEDAVPSAPGSAGPQKKVVVPQNQISGITLTPPPSAPAPPTNRPPTRLVQQQDATNRDRTGGIDQSRLPGTPATRSKMFAFAALLFAILAVVAVFWLLWVVVS